MEGEFLMDYNKVFEVLNLDYPGLEEIKSLVEDKEYTKALGSLKKYFLNRKNTRFFIEEEEKHGILEYAKENFSEDIKEAIKVAEEVSDKIFLFRFRWDMERTNVSVKFDEEIKWDLVPFKDPEWPWMLNRHRYWVALGQAYWLTENEKYAKAFCQQLEHWIDNNPIDCAGRFYTWRTLDAGIRCENWLKSYQYFKHSPYFTDALLAKFITCIHQHCEYIYRRYNSFSKTSNWGFLENHGLFEAAVYIPEFKESSLWKEESHLRLKKASMLQVMKDGVHWEQSPMYHNEIFHCLMDNIVLAQKNGISMDADIMNTAKNMAYADLYYAKPNHCQPMKGDSDNTDVRDMLTCAALIFNDGILKFGGYPEIDFQNLFTFGLSGIEAYNSIKPVTPEKTSYAFETSGNYVMRSGWMEEDLYLNFHCGKVGAGHDHADTFNIDIHGYSSNLITDPGRYTYMEGPERDYFKECKAHNTTIVDGVNFTEWDGAWGIKRTADAFSQRWISEEGFDYVEGGHKGYSILENPVYPFRKVLFVKSCAQPYWVLIDTFETSGNHVYSQYFHFACNKAFLDNEKNICYTECENSANIRIIPVEGKKVQGKLHDTYISFEYNLKEENKTVEYSCTGEGFTSMINVLYPQRPGENFCPKVEGVDVYDNSGRIVKNTTAEAFKVIFDANEEHIVLISHKVPASHTNFYIVDGTQVYGELVLIKRNAEGEKVIPIK